MSEIYLKSKASLPIDYKPGGTVSRSSAVQSDLESYIARLQADMQGQLAAQYGRRYDIINEVSFGYASGNPESEDHILDSSGSYLTFDPEVP